MNIGPELFQGKMQLGFLKDFATNICHTLVANTIVTNTSIVASIILTAGKGAYKDDITKRFTRIYKYVSDRGALMSQKQVPKNILTVEKSIQLLSPFLEQRKQVLGPLVTAH